MGRSLPVRAAHPSLLLQGPSLPSKAPAAAGWDVSCLAQAGLLLRKKSPGAQLTAAVGAPGLLS